MNNTFNLNRFGLLLKRQWLEFGKIYLTSLLVAAGVIVVFYLFNIPTPKTGYRDYNGFLRLDFRQPLFLILGFIFISIIASGYFAVLGQKPRAIIELMTPASVLEKCLCALFYTCFLSIFSFLIVFYLTDLVFVKYLEKSMGHISVTIGNQLTPHTASLGVRTLFVEWTGPETKFIYAAPFLVISVFLLGSIYFNRFHYIKTAVAVMLFSITLGYAIYELSSWMTSNKIQNGNAWWTRPEFENTIITYVLLGMIVITLFFWVVTFFRLKEKEV